MWIAMVFIIVSIYLLAFAGLIYILFVQTSQADFKSRSEVPCKHALSRFLTS